MPRRLAGGRGRVTMVARLLGRTQLANLPTITFAVIVLLAVLAPVITSYRPGEDRPVIDRVAAHRGLTYSGRTPKAWTSSLASSTRPEPTCCCRSAGSSPLPSVASCSAVSPPTSGGWVDEVISRSAEMIQSIPLFLFALMVIAALDNSRVVLGGIIAVFYTPAFYKVARSVAAPLLSTDFVAAAQTAGRTGFGIILRHVVPNSVSPVASQVSVNIGFAIQVVAGLSFLGLGIPIPEPEWGAMIAVGASRIAYGEWWMAFFPGLAVFITVIALDGIRRRLLEGAWWTR